MVMTLVNCSPEKAPASGQPVLVNLLDDDIYIDQATEFISGFRLLPLQEPDTSNLLTQVSEVIPYGDKLIVRDAKGPAVKAYDTTGRFLFQYGRKGQGPGEYWDLASSDVAVMPQLSEVWLWSNRQLSILRYKLDTGEFVGAHRFKFYPDKFMPTSKDEVFFFTNGNPSPQTGGYNLVKANLMGEISKKYSPFVDQGRIFGFTGFFSNGFYCPSYSDSVFQLVNDELVPRYVFVTGDAANKALPPLALTKHYLGNKFYDLGDYCFFTYVHKKKKDFCLYNKRAGKVLKMKNQTEQDFYWAASATLAGTDPGQQALLVNIDAESLPGLLAYFKSEQIAPRSPLPSPLPTTGQVLVYVYLK
jgi:hypothetical protein